MSISPVSSLSAFNASQAVKNQAPTTQKAPASQEDTVQLSQAALVSLGGDKDHDGDSN
jgi:hypothetical protein